MYVLKTILNTNKQNVLGSYDTINDAVKHIYHIKNKDLTYCIEYKED